MSNFITSTASGISQRTTTYAERRMLRYAERHLVLEMCGMPYKFQKNKGINIKWRRPIVFDAVVVPLTEGTPPTPTSFAYEDVTTSIYQYGQIIGVTDVIQDTHEDPVIQDISKQAGENIGRSVEALNYAVVRAGTSVYRANGAARTDINTAVSATKLAAALRTLKRNKAMPFSEKVGPGPNFNSVPIEECYIAVCHVDAEDDIRGLPGFKHCSEYSQPTKIHRREFGSWREIRFVTSADLAPWADAGGAKAGTGGTMVSSAGTNADVYPIMIFGKESWAHVALRGEDVSEASIIPPSRKEKSDPLGQRGVVGWKIWHRAVILNQSWMTRLEVAVTDLEAAA